MCKCYICVCVCVCERERVRESVPVAMEIVCFVPLSKGCSVSVEVGVSGKWGRGCSVASSVL